ncbi:hypothetical protein Xclt_20730 [Xanthomonas axonopodis pv. clitoriae]|uniref:Uncharacterized protein n=1 Tax=Xanthomonas axonopodis pv. clitoriae TaxID=487828 RepID=A0AB73NHY2_9XANT|nr:hypothetical protein Xclt_20730 [Xanthomonas axonopodis pv. clitoriae]
MSPQLNDCHITIFTIFTKAALDVPAKKLITGQHLYFPILHAIGKGRLDYQHCPLPIFNSDVNCRVM